MNITCTIDDRELKTMLAQVTRFITDTTQVMSKVGQYYERRVVENFSAQASPAGTPWKPLSAATMMLGIGKARGFKKSGYLGKRGRDFVTGKLILVGSGDLRESVHNQAENGRVTIGTGGHIPYAGIHQFGSMAGRGRKVKIPARPFLAENHGTEMVLAERDRQRIIEIFQQAISAAVGG